MDWAEAFLQTPSLLCAALIVMLEHGVQPSPARTIRQHTSCAPRCEPGWARGIPGPEILLSLTPMLSVHITDYCQVQPAGMGCAWLCLASTQIVCWGRWSLQDAGDAVVHCLQSLLEFKPWWILVLCLKKWITDSEQAQCWDKPHSTSNVPSEKFALCHCILR